MPIINLTRLFEFIAKLALFGFFSYFLVSSINSFTDLFVTIVSYMGSGANGVSSSVNGLDLGCIAEKIGLVTFLNTLFIIVYNAVGLYISSVISIIVFKFTTKAYTVMFKV